MRLQKLQNYKNLTYLEQTTTGANIVGMPEHTAVGHEQCTCNCYHLPIETLHQQDSASNASPTIRHSTMPRSPSSLARKSKLAKIGALSPSNLSQRKRSHNLT